MNSSIEVLACRVINERNELSQNGDVFCQSLHRDQFLVGAIQVYSDRLQTTPEAHAVFFYSSHVALHKFTEDWRETYISSWRTIVACIPVYKNPSNCNSSIL